MIQFPLRLFLFSVLILTTSAIYGAVDYKPYDGLGGYQEIKVSDDIYYVGFHGTRTSKYDEVDLAWSARGAQLCLQAGAGHYVELAFLFEPLTKKERDLFLALEPAPRFTYAADFIIIPIPMNTITEHSTSIDAPSKLGAIRCVRSIDDILDKKRLISVSEKIKEANQANIGINIRSP